MATTPELHEPQIAAARAQAWHQATDEEQKDPLLTLEAARSFLEQYGLLLFAPRPLGAPAPSLVEATLGAAKPTVTAADAGTARTLVARLVGEGSAVPLNLLGGPGEIPDFLVSASAFPFVFTLRGDKGWKRPPETSGAVKVTPLALRVYELLGERGGMTIANMVPEIGREVTESAITRALAELWSLLRVIPVLQQGEGETLWELITTRFLKAVKAGANAGQPTALSALVSLYLGQAFLATSDEIESFLSPLTARSRVREVLHGLTAGRQLSEAVLDGKTVLYIPEALPDFAQFAPAAEAGTEVDAALDEAVDVGEGAEEAPAQAEDGSRIRRFDAKAAGGPRGNTLRGKPMAREGGARPSARPGARGGPRPSGDRPRSYTDRGDRPAFGGGGERPRGPRPDRPAGDRPSFARPWDEERQSRPPRADGESRPGFDRPSARPEGDRPPRREGTEGRPFRPARPREDSRPPRREGGAGDRPPFRREGGEGRPPFRREGGEGRPPFRREGGAGRRPFTPREGGGTDRPAPRRPFAPKGEGTGFNRGGDRPFRGGDRGEGRGFQGGGDRPRPSRFSSDRDPGDRSSGSSGASGPSFNRPFPRREGGSFERPPRPAGDRPSFNRPSGGFRPRSGEEGRPSGQDRGFSRGPQGRPPFRAGSGEGRPQGDRPARGGEGAGSRPGGPRSGPGGFNRSPGGFSGGAGGFSRGAGGFKRGPGGPPFGGGAGRGGAPRGPGRGPDRGPSRGPSRDRPAPGRRPEDEA